MIESVSIVLLIAFIFTGFTVYTTIYFDSQQDTENSWYPLEQLKLIAIITALVFGLSFFLLVSAAVATVSVSIVLLPITIFFSMGVLWMIVIRWDREHNIYNTSESEPVIVSYSFILPLHTYTRSYKKWFKTLDPRYKIIEYHIGSTDNNEGASELPNKYVFEFKDEEELLDNIYTDNRIYHTCTFCEDTSKEFARVKKVWNNPEKQEQHKVDMCVSCYVELLDDIETEVDSFKSPTDGLIARRI